MKTITSLLIIVLIVASCSNERRTATPECDFDTGPCVSESGEKKIFLDIEPKPVTVMTELNFEVRLENFDNPQSVALELSMPGMSMGLNRINLIKDSGAGYRGTGIIPRCASGKKLWKATILIDGQTGGEFLFHVHY